MDESISIFIDYLDSDYNYIASNNLNYSSIFMNAYKEMSNDDLDKIFDDNFAHRMNNFIEMISYMDDISSANAYTVIDRYKNDILDYIIINNDSELYLNVLPYLSNKEIQFILDRINPNFDNSDELIRTIMNSMEKDLS